MQFYLLLPFFIVLFKRVSLVWLVFIFSIILSMTVFSSEISGLYKWGLLVYFPLFVFGYALFRGRDVLAHKISKYKVVYLLIPVLLLLLSYKGDGYDNSFKPYEILVAIIYGLLMLSMSSFSVRNEFIKILCFIGSASFSIYLYNYIYMSIKPSVDFNPVSSIVMWLSVIIVGISMYYIVECQTEKLRKKLFLRKKEMGNLTQERTNSVLQ